MSIQFRTRNNNIQPIGVTGACCMSISGEGCEENQTFLECADKGGEFLGSGSTCVECTEERISRNLTGACCACDGSCTDEVTEDWCRSRYLDPSTPRASFHSGLKCDEVECISLTTFDCCSNGVVFAGICNETLCRELGGRTADYGQGCDNSNLVAFSGACCNISIVGYERPCQYMDVQDPRWNGSPEAMCISLGGTFFQEENCSEGFCVDEGRTQHTCCRSDGCVSLEPEMCINSNGVYLGELGCNGEPCKNIEWGACVTDQMCLSCDRNTCHEYSGEWFPGYSCNDTFIRGPWKNEPKGKVCRVFGEPQCIDNISEIEAIEIVTQDSNDTEWVFIENSVCDECQENYHCYNTEDEIGLCIYSHVSENINPNPRSRSAFYTSKGWCRHLANQWASNSNNPISNIFKGCGTDSSHLKLLKSLPVQNPDSYLDGYVFDYYGSVEDGFAVGACSVNGICHNNLSINDCQSQGGSYMGNGTHCGSELISNNNQVTYPDYSNYETVLTRSTLGRFIEFISASYYDQVGAIPEFYYRTDIGIHPPMKFPTDDLELRSPTYNSAVRAIRGTKLKVGGANSPITNLSKIKTLSLIKSDANGRYSSLDIHGINFNILSGLKKLEMMPDQNISLQELPVTIEELNLQGNVKSPIITVEPKLISGNQYVIDGVERNTMFAYRGQKFIIDVSDPSLDGHPMWISDVDDGEHSDNKVYQSPNLSSVSSSGKVGANLSIEIDTTTPNSLYYYCRKHPQMGGEIQIRDYFANNTLNLSSKVSLKKLFVNDVNLNSLTLPESDSLNILDCSGNNISDLNISNHPYIYSLDVSYNNLSSLDLSNFGSFDGDGSIDVSHNNITSLTLPSLYGGTKLRHISAHDNPLVIANIQNDSKIDVIDLSYTDLSFFEMPSGTEVKELYMHNCRLSEIIMSGIIDNTFDHCTIIDVSTNNLTSVPFIDRSTMTIPRNLDYLNLSNNNLSIEALQELMTALSNSYGTHLSPNLVVNITNNQQTFLEDHINNLRNIWGNRLTIINNAIN